MAPMGRDIAVSKLKALAQGAELARRKFANRGQSPNAKRKKARATKRR
jgi:hypothetical protein